MKGKWVFLGQYATFLPAQRFSQKKITNEAKKTQRMDKRGDIIREQRRIKWRIYKYAFKHGWRRYRSYSPLRGGIVRVVAVRAG